MWTACPAGMPPTRSMRPRDYYGSRFEPHFRDLQGRIWEILRREMQGVLGEDGRA